MRTNVVLDDELMHSVLKIGNFPSKKAAIEAGLHLILQMKSQEKIRALRGKVKWEGDLDKMRIDR